MIVMSIVATDAKWIPVKSTKSFLSTISISSFYLISHIIIWSSVIDKTQYPQIKLLLTYKKTPPDSKVHDANMGPTWVLSSPGGPHVGPMNLAIWACILKQKISCKKPLGAADIKFKSYISLTCSQQTAPIPYSLAFRQWWSGKKEWAEISSGCGYIPEPGWTAPNSRLIPETVARETSPLYDESQYMLQRNDIEKKFGLKSTLKVKCQNKIAKSA